MLTGPAGTVCRPAGGLTLLTTGRRPSSALTPSPVPLAARRLVPLTLASIAQRHPLIIDGTPPWVLLTGERHETRMSQLAVDEPLAKTRVY